MVSFQYDILLCSENLVSDILYLRYLRIWSQVFVLLPAGFGRPVLLCRGRMPRALGMAAYERDGYGEFLQPKFETCGCFEMLVFMVCGAGSNFYMFNLYRSHDIEFHIFD